MAASLDLAADGAGTLRNAFPSTPAVYLPLDLAILSTAQTWYIMEFIYLPALSRMSFQLVASLRASEFK